MIVGFDEVGRGSLAGPVMVGAAAFLAAHLPRVGAILDGPSDHITKALGTFEAPAGPVPAHGVPPGPGAQPGGSVACAAVLAKVTRDRLMTQLADSNPDYARYGWAHNKGYGSPAHKAAIAQYGPCDEHRTSWKLLCAMAGRATKATVRRRTRPPSRNTALVTNTARAGSCSEPPLVLEDEPARAFIPAHDTRAGRPPIESEA